MKNLPRFALAFFIIGSAFLLGSTHVQGQSAKSMNRIYPNDFDGSTPNQSSAPLLEKQVVKE